MKLPRDPADGCATHVYPHHFPRMNNIFELIKAGQGRTAWSDKHPAYEFVNGPSGAGADDLYTPEITTAGASGNRSRYRIVPKGSSVVSWKSQLSPGNRCSTAPRASLLAASGLNFVGNVEGRDLMSDAVDVVVTDGFTGNVALKTLEGGLKFLVQAVTNALSSSEEARRVSHVLLDALAPVAAELDPDTTGGAMLLGVEGVCIIRHGSSSARAIVNAVRVASEMVDAGLVGRLSHVVAA